MNNTVLYIFHAQRPRSTYGIGLSNIASAPRFAWGIAF